MQKSFLRETAGVLMRATVVVLTIIVVFVGVSALFKVDTGISDGTCNIAVLPIEGAILPFHGLADFDMIITPETVESFMSTAEEDRNIEAVLLEINSPGGTPVASQRIAERFRKSSLPVVGLVGDVGASGGYMVAASTDFLIASPMSSIGSIGVNMSYLEESEKNEEEGITYVQLTTGKFKDTGSPNRPITEEERELLETDLLVIHNEFIDIVSEYRGIERAEVEVLADGATMPGERALENNLIDSLGGRSEATGVLATILEKDPRDIVYCEYERGFLPF
tara:strand:- start:49 stop:888 length:840 start_codon:yes stop_codon:yes gene_type:complete